MDTICLNDIKNIIRRNGGVQVSIFMPAHHRGGEDQQDPIRLRNLLRVAEEKLVARGLRSTEARAFLRPVEPLLTDNLFWRQQSDGLALFIAANEYFYYRVPVILREEVGVGERFYIKPLVSLLSDCGWFYVLALSQNEIRFLQCTASGSVRINPEDIPKNIEEALRIDSTSPTMQYHAAAPIGGGNVGAMAGIQTEAPSKADYLKDNMIRYFEQINKGLMKILRSERALMVLAGVDYLHPIYRKANSYRNLLPEGILGNPDGVSDNTLREQAWSIVKPYFDKNRQDAVADFHKSAGTGLTAAGLNEVVAMAFQGRIRFLFIADNSQFWGKFNTETSEVTVHSPPEPEDEELVDLAAFQTLNHAGTIYEMKPEDIPGGARISAILRF